MRRQEGGITTGVAIHNLESSPGLVRCELMRKGVLRDSASIPLEANGQTAWLIDQAFPRRRYVRLRLLYILAKLTQYIDLRAYGETEGTKWLSKYTSGGFEIEHIFPQQPSSEATVEFGEHEDPDIADLLGNLVLVERPAIGKTKIDSAVLDPFPEWNEAAVIERQNKLTVLARSVWRLPTSSVE